MHATHFAPSGLSLRLRIAMISAQRVHSEWLTGTLTAAQPKQTWRHGGSIDGFFFFHLLPRLLDPVLCSASFCYMLAAPNSQLPTVGHPHPLRRGRWRRPRRLVTPYAKSSPPRQAMFSLRKILDFRTVAFRYYLVINI